MATRLKTTEWVIPTSATLADNTLTAMSVITAYIPEFSGTVTIKRAKVRIHSTTAAGAGLGNYTSRRIDVSVGGAGATSYTSGGTLTLSGEDNCQYFNCDCTAHFTANWTSGTSKTIALSVLLDHSNATPPTHANLCATLTLTYEYDDTQTTQIKTVYIPLNAPVGALATSKPGTATATIPALDTELPEASKTIRNMALVVQGTLAGASGSADGTLSMQVDTYTAYTSNSMECGAASDLWLTFQTPLAYYDSGGSSAGIGMDTSTTHGFYLWASVARHHHQQAYLMVTYEFNASSSTSLFVSVRLPVSSVAHAGGTTSNEFYRFTTELWIAEPATVTSKQIAFYAFWHQQGAVASPNWRVGTGSFVGYTDTPAVLCGSNGCMVRNDAAFTLARGKNTITADVYSSDSNDLMAGIGGYFLLNYTCGKPTQGVGAANHTVEWPTTLTFVETGTFKRTATAAAIGLPETAYFLQSYGLIVEAIQENAGQLYLVSVMLERSNAAGQWYQVVSGNVITDPEGGSPCVVFGEAIGVTKQFVGDLRTGRIDLEDTRRVVCCVAAAAWMSVNQWITYHSVTFAVAGTVSGYADADGAGLTVTLHRVSDGLQVGSATTTAGGAYSITWFDDTENVFASCREDSTHVGRSDNVTPT
jgi:hypothetical protein